MLNKIFKYILLITLGVSAVACSDCVDTPKKELIPDSPGTVTLRFRNSELTRSQASDDSETLIESLYIALYAPTADEEAQPVAFESFTGLTDHTSSTVTMQLTDAMITGLFGDVGGASCKMYVLANLPAESAAKLSQLPTVSEMKSLEVTAPFDTRKVQQSFVMAGEGTVTYTKGVAANDPGKASGEATVYRAAAKIRLNLNLPASITVTNAEGNEETWVPQTTGIQCLLSNGVKTAIANPVPATALAAPWEPSSDDAYYDGDLTNGESVRAFSDTGTGTYPWVMDVPFYTFPNAWTENIEERHKTTITLMVAWALQGTDSYHTYYYQVPVTSQELPHIDRNYAYNVNLTVGMLGSLVPEVPIVLDPLSYQVVNWNSTDVDVNIQDFRYLVVNPNVITVNNEAEVVIPFYSSHPVSLDDISITYQRFAFVTATGNADMGKVVEFTIDEEQIDKSNNASSTQKLLTWEETVDASNTSQKIIKINHPLNLWTPVGTNGNAVSLTGYTSASDTQVASVASQIDHYIPTTDPAYSAYVIKIHIAHSDEPKYDEDITITQYPGMYIEADRNPATSTTGNVFVNGYSNESGGLGNVNGIVQGSSSGNKNPNMYIISISQLTTTDYIIGDPRTLYYNNDLSSSSTTTGTGWNRVTVYSDLVTPTSNGAEAGTWCTSATALYDNDSQRRLKYYYPTIESQDPQYSKMIAPKIRVASSWGVVGTLNRVDARRRCATYQENSRPAGRWRLPTLGEFTYVTQLSATNKIPTLFTVGSPYWTAQGAYEVDSKGVVSKSTDNTAHVRAVYDEWYWELYPEYSISAGTNGQYQYRLGDVPRQEIKLN